MSGKANTDFLASPTGWILAGGLFYMVYLTFKTIEPAAKEGVRAGAAVLGAVANLVEGSNPRIVPRVGSPIAAADPNGALAPIVGDPENGTFAWDWKVTVQFNNNGPERVVELKVKADYVSPVLPNSSAQTFGNIKVPPGKSLIDVYVARPTLMSEIAYDAYFQSYVNGKAAGPHKFFSP